MLRLSIRAVKYSTLGYSAARRPQVRATVLLHKGDSWFPLWNSDSGAGFAQYGHKDVLPAAKAYAKGVAEMLELPPAVVWTPKEPRA